MIAQWQGSFVGLSPLELATLGTLAVLIALIVLVLKGMSLWCAAKRNEKWWFVILMIVNTLGILELVYLIFVAKKWNKPVSPASGVSSTLQ
jgi:uncharacterized integral membrane protein